MRRTDDERVDEDLGPEGDTIKVLPGQDRHLGRDREDDTIRRIPDRDIGTTGRDLEDDTIRFTPDRDRDLSRRDLEDDTIRFTPDRDLDEETIRFTPERGFDTSGRDIEGDRVGMMPSRDIGSTRLDRGDENYSLKPDRDRDFDAPRRDMSDDTRVMPERDRDFDTTLPEADRMRTMPETDRNMDINRRSWDEPAQRHGDGLDTGTGSRQGLSDEDRSLER